MSATGNLWNHPNIPHKGWTFVDVIDTEAAESTCEMCGNERIRYIHIMSHSDYLAPLNVGCICAEKMSGDYVNPKLRERKLRNAAAKRIRDKKRDAEEKEARRQSVISAVWRESKNGNPYLSVYLDYKHGTRKIHAVIVKSKFTTDWAFSVNGEFSKYVHPNAEAAKVSAKQEILRKFAQLA
jgi:hypothetical protein